MTHGFITTDNSSVISENNLDTFHWMIGTISRKKRSSNTRVQQRYSTDMIILHQKHFKRCIRSTIGRCGSLSVLQKDSGRRLRINWNFLIGLENNSGIIHWTIGTTSLKP